MLQKALVSYISSDSILDVIASDSMNYMISSDPIMDLIW